MATVGLYREGLSARYLFADPHPGSLSPTTRSIPHIRSALCHHRESGSDGDRCWEILLSDFSGCPGCDLLWQQRRGQEPVVRST